MPGIIVQEALEAEVQIDCLIIGGGAAGLTAALAANEAGISVLVVEREAQLSGSTALSSGLVPAATTAAQKAQSIDDSVDVFISDIMAKNKNLAAPDHVQVVVEQIPKTIDWLMDEYDIPFIVLDNFLYPGHSNHRMHAVPEVTGAALINRLEAAVSANDITVITNLQVTDLIVTRDGSALGAKCMRPDNSAPIIAAKQIILACNGYGGNPDLVKEHIPEMKDALYFGHPGNQGEAVLWGQELGADLAHLSGYQGHGSVAHPHGILVTWAVMMEGGIQVNLDGKRFSNEHGGYSEQAVAVLAQPNRTAFNIFDERLCKLGSDFEDFRVAKENNAFVKGDTLDGLATVIGLDPVVLQATIDECNDLAQSGEVDAFGRRFESSKLLKPPYYAVRVTGALFHTQGGLVINADAQVCRSDIRNNDSDVINCNDKSVFFETIMACGGAACGVSGPDVSGYLSGNGLLTALSLGHIAGNTAGKLGK